MRREPKERISYAGRPVREARSRETLHATERHALELCDLTEEHVDERREVALERFVGMRRAGPHRRTAPITSTPPGRFP